MQSVSIDLPPAEVLDDLCRRYGIKELVSFDAMVHGELRRGSDVHGLVEFQPGVRNGLFACVSCG